MSSFSVETAVMKSMVSKAVKGAGNNPKQPMTELIYVEVEDGTLRLTTTDLNNYLTISNAVDSEDNFNFVVKIDKFSKLIAKQTVDTITISEEDDIVQIRGNGTYTLTVFSDGDGSKIKFPKHEINMPECEGSISVNTIRDIVLHNKSSLAVGADAIDRPDLSGYFCTDGEVISGNGFNVCVNKISTFDVDALVPAVMFDLILMCKEDSIHYKIFEGRIIFETPTFKLYGVLMSEDDMARFPLDRIHAVCESGCPSECVVSKTTMLNVIDRLSLFIGQLDQNGMYLTFRENDILAESVTGSGTEIIPYQGIKNFKPFTCFANVDALKHQFIAREGESVKFSFGNESLVRTDEDNVILISSLLEDRRGR